MNATNQGAVMDLCSSLPFLPRTDLRTGTVEQEGRDADQMVINATVASNDQLGWASSLPAAISKDSR